MSDERRSSRAARRFNDAETRFQGVYSRSVLNTLFQAYQPAMARTLFLLFVGIVGRIALLANTNVMGYWVDTFCRAPSPCKAPPSLFSGFATADFLWLLGALTALGFVLVMWFRVGISRLSADSVSRVYDETTLRTSRLPMGFFDRNPAGRVMTRFSSDYNNVFRVFGGPLAEFVMLVFDLLAMTILIAVASPWFVPFWFLLAGLNYGVYRWNLPVLRAERREMALRRSPGIAHFAESAQGMGTIRAFGRQANFTDRFALLNDSYLEQRFRALGIFVRFSLELYAVTAVAFLATGLAGAALVREGWVSLGGLGVAFAYLGLSTTILQAFFEWLGQFEEAMTGVERMNEYLRLPIEPGARLPATARFRTGHPIEDAGAIARSARVGDGAGQGASIEIRDLWMRYREDLPQVLQGIDLQVNPGERLAVVGRTGSGKTSLVQALFRLYPIERGLVRVAGMEADVGQAAPEGRALSLEKYRGLLAYITQEPAMFLGSLRENLRPWALRGGATDRELIQALRRVQFLRPTATDAEYAHWLEYAVEERGRNLSAGEKQLVCMARCLLQDAPVVVLDEATSAVDPRSEEILTRATEEFFIGKTQIVIAHRLSTVRSCDRVLWLEDGKIRRLGPPPEVLPEFGSVELVEVPFRKP
ncbi:MAG: ABC transporter ATP-binding protein [Bdellovibrionales bacterium]|nr:ABC transporter ATP-binding protein [Bdellovibrionales bacterium]